MKARSMKIKVAIYVALLCGSLFMVIKSCEGSGSEYSTPTRVNHRGNSYDRGETGTGEERVYTKEELRTMGYNGEPNSGWTFAGSEYDVRGANYTSDHYLNRDWGWSELGGGFSENPQNKGR